jgi:hypothetical protein
MTLRTFSDRSIPLLKTIHTLVPAETPMLRDRRTRLQEELKHANAQVTFSLVALPLVACGVFLMANDPSAGLDRIENLKNVLHFLRPFFGLCLVLFTTATVNRKRIHKEIEDL